MQVLPYVRAASCQRDDVIETGALGVGRLAVCLAAADLAAPAVSLEDAFWLDDVELHAVAIGSLAVRLTPSCFGALGTSNGVLPSSIVDNVCVAAFWATASNELARLVWL